MQPRSLPSTRSGETATTVRRPSLAIIHAKALYRPTPPVECDDDGYPFSDAKPMSEGDFHGDVLDYAKGALRARFAGQDVYMSTDKFLFLEQGNRRAAVVPDILVAFGPPSGPRQSYKHWEEGKAPDFVLEVLSADNWRNDVERKPALYADLGVREYWVFDPRGIRRDGGPRLQGWRLNPSAARESIPPSATGTFRSEILGLDLFRDGRKLRFRDPYTGEVLPEYTELVQMRQVESAARETAQARADAADARAVAADARADAADARANAANVRLREETAARQAAERRIAALERQLSSRRD